METVHAYTNDQNLIDNYHIGDRRGRSAALNMVLTSTGAAKAVEKAIPELKGKLTGNSIRVPTPNVSMAILNLQLEKPTTVAELNEFLRQKALHSAYQQQIGYRVPPRQFQRTLSGQGRPRLWIPTQLLLMVKMWLSIVGMTMSLVIAVR